MLLPVVQLLWAECVIDVTYISCQEDDNPKHHQDRALLLETPQRSMQQKITFHIQLKEVTENDVKNKIKVTVITSAACKIMETGRTKCCDLHSFSLDSSKTELVLLAMFLNLRCILALHLN